MINIDVQSRANAMRTKLTHDISNGASPYETYGYLSQKPPIPPTKGCAMTRTYNMVISVSRLLYMLGTPKDTSNEGLCMLESFLSSHTRTYSTTVRKEDNVMVPITTMSLTTYVLRAILCSGDGVTSGQGKVLFTLLPRVGGAFYTRWADNTEVVKHCMHLISVFGDLNQGVTYKKVRTARIASRMWEDYVRGLSVNVIYNKKIIGDINE